MVRKVLTRRTSLWAIALPLALPACAQTVTSPASPPPASGRCHAAPAQGLVGKKATREMLEQARIQAGARIVRMVAHDEIITQEYNASRLTVLLDERGTVAEVRCG